MVFFLFVLGLAALIVGAEVLVRGASRLAAAVRVSPLVIGLTVVAFGTSAPELAVSIQSASLGQADLALGNVVGSNIFNVLFILGVAALIAPLQVSLQVVRLDVPIMIGVSGVAFLMGLDGGIGRLDGAVLFAGLVGYTVWSIRQSRKESKPEGSGQAGGAGASGRTGVQILWIVLGLALLVVGSRWLVGGAVVLAEMLGVSELVIGLTVVAAGTSLPEVAASVVAGIRGERDIAVGNVVGSNIFNLLAVLGISGIVAPDGVHVAAGVLRFDIPVMVGVAVACLPVFFTGHRIARWEGGLFLAYYAAYTAYLVLSAARHDALPAFNSTMLLFVLPLTFVTLLISVFRSLAREK